MIEEYYAGEQRDDLQPRERGLGAEAVEQTESEWSQLIAMLELAQRWQELIGEFTGEDAHPDGRNADELGSTWRCSNSERTRVRAAWGRLLKDDAEVPVGRSRGLNR